MARRGSFDPAALAAKPVRNGNDAGVRTVAWVFANRPAHRYSGVMRDGDSRALTVEPYCRICGQPGDGTGRHHDTADAGIGLGGGDEPLAVLRMTPKLHKVILAGLQRAYYHPGGSGPSPEDYRWAWNIVDAAHPEEEE
jgi:hypothetical protein